MPSCRLVSVKLGGLLTVVVAIAVVAAVAYVRQPEAPHTYCELAATIPSGEPVDIEDRTFWIDSGLPPDDEGCGPTYMPQDLNRVDGVLYSDCRILWSMGGATDAETEGIPCNPG